VEGGTEWGARLVAPASEVELNQEPDSLEVKWLGKLALEAPSSRRSILLWVLTILLIRHSVMRQNTVPATTTCDSNNNNNNNSNLKG
jgi:hypothetical protein